MKLEHAAAIVEGAYDMGRGEDEIRIAADYSGRGMYGQTTAGIVFDSLGTLLEAVAYTVAGLAAEDEDADSEAVAALIDDLRRVRQDNLGRDTIIY
jgi:hypothetical protein